MTAAILLIALLGTLLFWGLASFKQDCKKAERELGIQNKKGGDDEK